MRAAERGDLTGRAAQAVELDRVDASPVQVDAADELLRANPLGSAGLFTALDPAAACVAAAHWLVAAATVAGDADDREPWEVFAESDTIQACSIDVPTLIVEAISVDGRSPRDIVLGLLAAAALVRQGRVPDPDVVAEQVSDAYRQAEQAPPEQRDGVLRSLLPPRSTLLDPLRPSRDLLEHLLDGTQASLVLYREVAADESFDDMASKEASLGADTEDRPESRGARVRAATPGKRGTDAVGAGELHGCGVDRTEQMAGRSVLRCQANDRQFAICVLLVLREPGRCRGDPLPHCLAFGPAQLLGRDGDRAAVDLRTDLVRVRADVVVPARVARRAIR